MKEGTINDGSPRGRLRPATYYQVDLTIITPDPVYLIVSG